MIGKLESAIQHHNNVHSDGVIIITIVALVFVLDQSRGISSVIVPHHYALLDVVVDFGLILLLAQGSVCLFVPVVMMHLATSQAMIPLEKIRQGGVSRNVLRLRPLRIGKHIFVSIDVQEISLEKFQLIQMKKLKDV